MLDVLQARNVTYAKPEEKFLHPGKSCTVLHNGKTVGFMGALHPQVQERFGLSAETYVLEMDLSSFVEEAERIPQFTHIPQFPSTSRDIAVVVPKTVSAVDLMAEIRNQAGPLLKDVRLFDVYSGKQVKNGCKSVAFSLTFQDLTRTLQDKEINDIINQVVKKVQERFEAELRE